MKKTYITACIAGTAALLGVACSDFMNTYPVDALSPSTTWKTEDDAYKFLTGCYNGWLWGEVFFYYDCASDIGFNFHEEGAGFKPWGNGSMTSATPQSGNLYKFTTIRRCLTFLENIDGVEFADDAKKKDMIAQVRVIRAFEYFRMNWWYGGVPIISSYSDAEEAKVERSSEAYVKKYIYDELDAAIPDLYDAPKAVGQIGKGAALALKMRSALLYADWQRALDAAQALVALGIYELDPDYANPFTLNGRNSKEIILSQQHYIPGAEEWIVTIPNNADGGWSSMVPTQNLVDIYEMKTGLTKDEQGSGYDAQHPYKDRDPRMAKTILYPGQNWIGAGTHYQNVLNTLDETLPDGTQNKNYPTAANNSSKTALTWSKYVAPLSQYDGDFESTLTQYIVFRYAEAFLTIAEAANELPNEPITTSYDALDKIRRRAGMPDVDRIKYNSKDALRELIRRERTVELAGEGHRRADIVRWKDASGSMLAMSLLNGDLTRPTGSVNYDEQDEGLRATITGTAVVEPRTFAAYQRYLPIPQSAIDKNPKLKQNCGYGGSDGFGQCQ
jgi:hypothetical protein